MIVIIDTNGFLVGLCFFSGIAKNLSCITVKRKLNYRILGSGALILIICRICCFDSITIKKDGSFLLEGFNILVQFL